MLIQWILTRDRPLCKDWTKLTAGTNNVSPLSLFRGCPRDSNRTSVAILFRSLRMVSIAFHRVGWDCPTRDWKLLFQDWQMLLVLHPPCIVVTWTFCSSGGNSKAILRIHMQGMTPSRPTAWWIQWYILFQNYQWNLGDYIQDVFIWGGGVFDSISPGIPYVTCFVAHKALTKYVNGYFINFNVIIYRCLHVH